VDDLLGYGLIAPFRRDLKDDFANSGGTALIAASIGQILGTVAGGPRGRGELRWRTDFGSLLYTLRHRKNDANLQEVARVWIVDALTRWEPRIRLLSVTISQEEATPGGGANVLLIRLRYDILAKPGARNAVILPSVEQTVTL
jgi:phage baseplate assembly protein W